LLPYDPTVSDLEDSIELEDGEADEDVETLVTSVSRELSAINVTKPYKPRVLKNTPEHKLKREAHKKRRIDPIKEVQKERTRDKWETQNKSQLDRRAKVVRDARKKMGMNKSKEKSSLLASMMEAAHRQIEQSREAEELSAKYPDWTPHRQSAYLREHPKSRYMKAGVKTKVNRLPEKDIERRTASSEDTSQFD
jgi:hypothetical protein